LLQRRYQDKSVLEFGGGQSTLWWAARAKSVLCVEEDPRWCDRLRAQLPSNAEVHCISNLADIESLLKSRNRKFDLVVVDGGPRRQLARLSFDYMERGGALILDNSEGYGFYDEIKGRRCSKIDFFGFAPGILLRHCTSIIFVNDCFLLAPDVPVPNLN
jgi:predicted O-methyltransferase YrrM